SRPDNVTDAGRIKINRINRKWSVIKHGIMIGQSAVLLPPDREKGRMKNRTGNISWFPSADP
ncbi:MAG: hypothetical protein ACRD6X_01780, partial [Pyrinomonadaceae bacterium]